jgi:hypothetical protein
MDAINPRRSAEGWVIVESELRNDDPWTFDDNWHRGEYLAYQVAGTNLRIESEPQDGIGDVWNRFEAMMRANGLTGYVELVGHAAEGGHRRIVTIMTDEELAELKRQGDEDAAKYEDCPDDFYQDFQYAW